MHRHLIHYHSQLHNNNKTKADSPTMTRNQPIQKTKDQSLGQESIISRVETKKLMRIINKIMKATLK